MSTPPPSPPHSTSSSPIWSSRTPSPTSSPQTSVPTSSHSNTSDPAPPAAAAPTAEGHFFTIPHHIEGSEQPLIARTHYTNGYRAGISAGKDDPEIAQRGFDAGFPVGAVLAMRVGFLLEVVRECARVKTSAGEDEVIVDDARGTAAEEEVEADTMLEDAKRELDLQNLVEEMEAAGVLNPEGVADQDDAEEEQDTEARVLQKSALVDHLPSVVKWTQFVEATGLSASPG